MNAETLYGTDLFGASAAPKPSGPVAERFLFSPFTVLDAKSGDWQERKRAWMAIGIKSELGRGEGLLMNGASEWQAGNKKPRGLTYGTGGIHPYDDYGKKQRANACPGGSRMIAGYDAEGNRLTGLTNDADTSVFDPVLCEVAYRWFAPMGGQVVDPFAGGSVRGVLAKSIGLRYWGCDLRAEQIEANILQAEQIFEGFDGRSGDIFGLPDLKWVCGDSTHKLEEAPAADFIFSCPPYGDLETYSDDPLDLSTMDWPAFLGAYRVIIQRAIAKLRVNRFACFVVGDFRDGKGFYRNFVSETIGAFEAAGARLYNEAILATPVGSACMRVTKQFDASRKMAKTHQNVLVFCKGDPRKAAEACKAGVA